MKRIYSIEKWIEKMGGVEKTSRRLKVTTQAVRFWRLGKGAPQLKTILKMIELSQGALTLEVIARDSTRSLKGKARLRC